MRKNENKKASTNQSVCDAVGFHIEADSVHGGISVSVSGVLSILDFREEEAVLKIRRGRLKIVGTNLSVAVYENRTVEIVGRLCRVEFL